MLAGKALRFRGNPLGIRGNALGIYGNRAGIGGNRRGIPGKPLGKRSNDRGNWGNRLGMRGNGAGIGGSARHGAARAGEFPAARWEFPAGFRKSAAMGREFMATRRMALMGPKKCLRTIKTAGPGRAVHGLRWQSAAATALSCGQPRQCSDAIAASRSACRRSPDAARVAHFASRAPSGWPCRR